MGKITGYATVGMVLALAKKMAIQYGALGIADVRTTPDGSDLIFIMSDGSQHRVELNFSANGVDYDDSVTKFNVNNVQAAIEALFSELQANAGGLTVLRQSDFPLSADLLAKVKANPQNYCLSLKNDYSQDETFYYNRTTSTEIQYLGYYTTQYIVNALTHIGAEIRLSDGSLSVKVGNSVLFNIQSATNDFGIDKNTIRTIGVFAKTNNQTLSGDDLYLATTIDIGDDD